MTVLTEMNNEVSEQICILLLIVVNIHLTIYVCIILTDWIQNLHLFMNTYTHVDNVVCNTRLYISWNCIRMLCCQFQMLQHILTNYHNVGRYSETNTVSLVAVIFGRMVDSRGTHVLLWLLVFHSRSSSIQHSTHVKR